MAASIHPNLTNLPGNKDDSNFTICIAHAKNTVMAKGIGMGPDNLVHSVFPNLMLQLSLMFVTSSLLYFLLRPLKQPKFVCNILTGIIFGKSVLGQSKMLDDIMYPAREMAVINTLSIIGGAYFVFIITVKMDKGMFLKTIKKTWNVSLTVWVVPLTISLLAARLLHHTLHGVRKPTAFYISIVSSQTFFAVICNAISELNLLNSELGQLTISTAVLHEILAWLNSVLSPLVRKGFSAKFIRTEISFLVLALFAILVLRPAIQLVIRTTPEGKPVKQIYIVAILIGSLIMAILVDMIGSNFMLGATMMGLIIPAGPPLGAALVEKSEGLITNLFLPFLFIRVGQLTNIFSIKDWKAFASLELILVAAYAGKICGSLLALSFFKSSVRNALVFSCFLNIKGVIELIIFLQWRLAKSIDEQAFSTLVLSNLVVTAIVIPLISTFYKLQGRLESFIRIGSTMRTLQATLPNTELRILCCIHHEDNVNSIINLLRASNPTEMNPICAYVVHLIDLVGRAAPLVVRYDTQKRRLIPNSTDRIMKAVAKYSKISDPPVTIQPFKMVSPYNTMHQSVCKIAEENFIPLILLPFHQIEETERRRACSLQTFNNNVLSYAPCTVGIFADRGLSYCFYSCEPSFYCNVAVYFLGGPDDREAIALVKRMARNPCFSITIIRIDLGENLVETENQRHLDDAVMDEILIGGMGIPGVVCREMVADDSNQLMDAVKKMEMDFDLAIVGRRHAFSSRLEKEMKPWVEYEELGIIGDMLASADFVGERMMSVLVMQSAESFKELQGLKFDGSSSVVEDDDRRSFFSAHETAIDITGHSAKG